MLLENPRKVVMYRVNLTYKIDSKSSSKHIYLKREIVANPDSKFKLCRVYFRNFGDLGNGVGACAECPLPNALYSEPYPFLEMQKSKGKIVSAKEVLEILKDGQCIGIFSEDLTKRYI
jgi:hypothetical protein